MTLLSAPAPAKVNLTLHVTGQRADGYHLLDSLVVFADVSDTITVGPAPDLRLTVEGPFKQGVPLDETNIVMQCARLLRERRGVGKGAALTLNKFLPHAAGLGGGSSDAATTLKLLARFWEVEPLPPHDPDVVALGADVPVCLQAPSPMRMRGIGDELSPVPALPNAAVVLVNPREPTPTGTIYGGLQKTDNAPMDDIPERADLATFADWLKVQRNDLTAPAVAMAPGIEAALSRLRTLPAVKVAGMSGSGATCFALVKDMANARQVARVLQVAEQGWWVAPAALLR
ncbi:MAG: 4-(cytidine 5'-diphospho)-2-C-methyl-D-erythritol kinase [Paracoccaceae bacterium]